MTAESRWTKLFEAALAIIDRTNADYTVVDRWTFGGGTAMMLQLGHRDSFDVDLFVPDPQVLGYLSAALEGMSFEPGRPTYTGDGSRHLKVSFPSVGEIDFIVASPVTDDPSFEAIVMNRPVRMERVAEIVGKKVWHRGASVQSRDLFDIAVAFGSEERDDVLAALRSMPEHTAVTLERARSLREEAVLVEVGQLRVLPAFGDVAKDAYALALKGLGTAVGDSV